MNTQRAILTRSNIKFIYFVAALFVGLMVFLFLFGGQAYASKGYGWIKITGTTGDLDTDTCKAPSPYNSDVNPLSLLRQPVYSGDLKYTKGDIQVKPQPEVEVTVQDASTIVADCWNPATAMFYRVTNATGVDNDSGTEYHSAWGGINGGSNPLQWRGRDVGFGLWLVPTGSGSCITYCPSIENMSPSGGQWSDDIPTRFYARSRLLPYSLSNKVKDYSIQINCASSECVGFNGGETIRESTWTGSVRDTSYPFDFAARENQMTDWAVSNISDFNPPFMRSGEYVWFAFQRDDDEFITVNSGGNYFGVDRDSPETVYVAHSNENDPDNFNNPGVYDYQKFAISAYATDSLSGIDRIRLRVKVTDSAAATTFPNSGTYLWNYPCPIPPIGSNGPNVATCNDSAPVVLLGPRSEDEFIHYQACAWDKANNVTCDTGVIDILPLEPWLYTTGGNIGILGSYSTGFGPISMNQDRGDPASPAIPAGGFTSEYLLFGVGGLANVTSKFGWDISDPDIINMEKFPDPGGGTMYDLLWNKYSSKCSGGVPAMAGITATQIANRVGLNGCNILEYTVPGTAVFDNDTWTNGYTGDPAVLFFPGDLQIKRNLKICDEVDGACTAKTGLVFVVGGNIEICRNKQCNNNPLDIFGSNAVSTIDGFFITDGEFETDTNDAASPPDPVLIINGSVISFYSDGIDWRMDEGGRSLTGIGNLSIPSEIINYQPKYLWLFADEIGDSREIYSEEAP